MSPARGLLVGLSLLLVGACAATPATDRAVTHVPVAELRGGAGTLPVGAHLSTGQPDAKLLERAAAAGYVGVIDLRTPGEDRGYDEAAVAASLGLDYVALPVAGPAGVTFDNAAALDRALAGMDGPVLLHCASGNRVGALVALGAKAGGATDEEALAAGRAAGLTGLESVVRERLAATD